MFAILRPFKYPPRLRNAHWSVLLLWHFRLSVNLFVFPDRQLSYLWQLYYHGTAAQSTN